MRALITGVTGQDGSYLAEHLLARGYEVYGLVRRSSDSSRWRIAHISGLRVVDGDLLDSGSLIRAVEESQPDEVYNLAAQSFVGVSWREPEHTAQVTGLGALRLFEAVRAVAPKAHIYQASTSEMFGNAAPPLTAKGPFQPRSPYATAKLFAHATAVNYRESYGMHISCGLLFNHESPRRGREFVTRKVCAAAARIAQGDWEPLHLGNVNAHRDWGWAPDYVDAMHRMVLRESPADFVIASGETHSVDEFCALAFGYVGLDWREHVVVDRALLRPADVDVLLGDPSDAEVQLGWRRTVDFRGMIERMVDAELTAQTEPVKRAL